MLSLPELRRAARIVESRMSNARLQRIVQPDASTLVLTLYGTALGQRGTLFHLLLSCAPGLARLSLVEYPPSASATPPAFVQYVRAHLEGAVLEGCEIVNDDRQVALRFRARESTFELLLSILGARSNVYLLGRDRVVVLSLRPFAETRRDLAKDAPWTNPPAPPSHAGVDRWATEPDESYLEAIERTYHQLEQQQRAEDFARKTGHALRKEIDFLERKAGKLRSDLEGARQAGTYKRTGELLKTVLHTIKPGDQSAAVTDYATGEPLTIALDPTLSPAANLERYFARYHKATKGAAVLEQQLETVREAQAAMAALDEEFRAVERAGEIEALIAFASRPRVKKLLDRYYSTAKRRPQGAPKIAGKRAVPSRLLPRRYRSSDGLEIWVGRSDEGNDYLTTRLARGKDLFFHLEGQPGSHVVLRTEGRPDPPSESLLEACELAVHYSKQAGATRADVHVAPIKDVKKPTGAKSGLVHVLRGRTVHLRRDPQRLERILAARIED